MKNVAWLVVGIIAGFVVAHRVNRTRGGSEFLGEIDERIREFTESVTDAYSRREAELRARDAD